MPAAGLTALSAALRTSVIPLRYPFRGSGHPVEVVERRPPAAATAGTVPSRPLSRVLHLHQACRIIRLKLLHSPGRRQAAPDGPLAPASAQARGRASARSSFPRYQPLCIPLAPLLGGLGPPAPLDVHLHQVRLEDVGPRTPVQLHWATGSQGAGLACCPGKVDLYPLRRILQLVLLDGRVAGGAHRGLLPCDVDLKVRGGERRWSVTLSFVRVPRRRPRHRAHQFRSPARGFESHCDPTHTPCRRRAVRSDLPLREPVNDRHAHVGVAPTRGGHLHLGDELGGVLLVDRSPPPAPRTPSPCGRCRSHPGRGAIAASRRTPASGPSRLRAPSIPQHRRHRPWGARPGVCPHGTAPAAAAPAGRYSSSWAAVTMEPVHQPVEVPGTDRKASPTLPRAGVLVVGRLVFFLQIAP